MAQAGKYGYIAPEDGFHGIHPEEPVFVLRAQDVLSTYTLTKYIRLANAAGLDPAFINQIIEARREFLAWQMNHHVKFPD